MKRREFSAAAAVTAAGIWPLAANAQRRLEEGRDFRQLAKRVPVEAPAGKIEVVEFFWYSCPHCNAFEPKLEAWIRKQSPDVVVRRVPVAFRDDFVPQQRLFYALEAMGKLEELHGKVFEAIHVKREPTSREDLIVAFAEKNGLDKAKFQEIYNSFAVQAKARRATQLQDGYGVEGVPSLGVGGRFYTDATMTGNMDRALMVVDQLVEQLRQTKT